MRQPPLLIACYDWLFPTMTAAERARAFENFTEICDKMRDSSWKNAAAVGRSWTTTSGDPGLQNGPHAAGPEFPRFLEILSYSIMGRCWAQWRAGSLVFVSTPGPIITGHGLLLTGRFLHGRHDSFHHGFIQGYGAGRIFPGRMFP